MSIDFDRDEGIPLIHKMVLLFILDQMDFPITDDSILNITSESNAWIPWMECKEAIAKLVEINMVSQVIHESKIYYTLTADGRLCLSNFYNTIPASEREEIAGYIAENRMKYKRRQEYFRTYTKNSDGTYTVKLKIVNPGQTLVDLTLNVSSRQIARNLHETWDKKAGNIYRLLQEHLIDEWTEGS